MARKTATGSAVLPAMTDEADIYTSSAPRTTRTTLVIPEPLDQNLELYAVKTGIPKGEVIKRVLTEFLIKQGFQPDKRPKSIEIAY